MCILTISEFLDAISADYPEPNLKQTVPRDLNLGLMYIKKVENQIAKH
jgi:hypothetical protein